MDKVALLRRLRSKLADERRRLTFSWEPEKRDRPHNAAYLLCLSAMVGRLEGEILLGSTPVDRLLELSCRA